MGWPNQYNFDDLLCFSDKKNGKISSGVWREVFPVRVENNPNYFVAKVLRDSPTIKFPIKRLVDMLRRLTGLDENSREWRFLKMYASETNISHLLPSPLSQGLVDGRKAILVERILFNQQSLTLGEFMVEATQTQKNIIKKCIEEIDQLFGKNHIVCNDIGPTNIMVSDRNGGLSLVVVDGFGNNHLVPYPLCSKRLNALKISRRLNRMKRNIGLD